MAITYSVSTNTITVTAYTSGTPGNFTDIYNADKAGTLSLHARTGIAGTDGSPVAVDRAERPADYIILGGSSNDLYITITNYNASMVAIRITGTDRDGAAQTEDIIPSGNGTFYPNRWFKTITHTQVVSFTGTTVDYDLIQGQWGVVWRECVDHFCFAANLQIGDGSTATYLASEDEVVQFGVYGSPQAMWATANSNVRIGKKESNGASTHGSMFVQYSTRPATLFGTGADSFLGDVEIYASKINILKHESSAAANMYSGWQFKNTIEFRETSFNGHGLGCISPCAGSFTRCNVSQDAATVHPFWLYATAVSFDDTKIYYSNDGIRVAYGYSATMDNCVFKNNTNDIYIWDGWTGTINLINCEFDSSKIAYRGACTGYTYEKYTFDLKLVDSTGSGISTTKVKIWDNNDSLVTNTTTDASGVLATQTLNYGYYVYATGSTPVMQTPHEIRIYKYGKSMLSSSSSIEALTNWAFTMLTDDHITQTTEATVAAYTGITINHTTETITISSDHTLHEIYDYCQYDMIAATKQIDQVMHTTDGVNFVSEYSFVVNTGITVTATDLKLSMVSGETYTLTGTAQFTGIIATTTTTRIPIKLTNIVDGSRYWVGKESDGSTIFEGTQSGSGTVDGYYEHTANTNIVVRVRKSSASVKYLPWVGEGTLVAEAFSLRIRQIVDNIVA